MAYRSKRNVTRQTVSKNQDFYQAHISGDSDLPANDTDDYDNDMETRDGLPQINGAKSQDPRNKREQNRRTEPSYGSRIPVAKSNMRVPNANRDDESNNSVTPVRERFRAREVDHIRDRDTRKGRINLSKKVTFYRNGDKHFQGRIFIITRQRYRSFENLVEDLSKAVPLPYGVRYIFTPDGYLVTGINDLADGGSYICSSGDNLIRNIDYVSGKKGKRDKRNNADSADGLSPGLSVPSDSASLSSNSSSRRSSNEVAKPRVITIYNNTDKTVKCKILLNRKTAKSYEEILKDVSEMMKLRDMHVKELYSENGTKVGGLSEMFRGPDQFFAVTTPNKIDKRNLSNPSSQSSNGEGISPTLTGRKQQKSRKKQRRDQAGNSQGITIRVKGKKLTYYPPTNNERLMTDEDDAEAFSPPDIKPQLQWVYGYQGKDTQQNLHVLPSGELLYFVSRVVVIHNRKTNTQRHYTGHADDIKCIAVHPNQWYIASGQASGLSLDQNEMSHIRIWDAETLITLAVLSLDDYSLSIAALAFSVEDNGKQLACIDSSGDYYRLNLWDWEDRNNMAQSKELSSPVLALAFDPDDSKTIVSCGKEHIYFWRWHNEKLERKNGYFEKYPVPQYLTCIDFVPNGDVCTGDSSGCITVWGKVSKKVKFVVRNAHEKSILCVRVLNNGTLLTAGGVDGRVCAWDANKYFNMPLQEVQIPEDLTGISALEPLLSGHGDDVTLLLGTTSNNILEGSFTSEFITLVKGNRNEVPSLAVHPSEDVFVTASLDKVARLWSALKHEVIWSVDVEFPIRSAAFYTTGSVVAFGTTRGRWIVLNAQTGMHMASFQDGTEPISDIEYSPDGEHIAVGSKDGNIYVHSVYDDGMTYRRVGCCSNHTSPVMFLDWSVDGCFITSMSTEYEHITWEIGEFKREESHNVIRDTEWNTRNVVLGYDIAGVWQSTPTEGNLVSSSDLSWSHDVIAIGDELGYIRLFRYPCCHEGAQYHQVRAHSSSVARIMFLASDAVLLSTAGLDGAVMQWSLEGKLGPLAEEDEDPDCTPEPYYSEDYTSPEENDRRRSENFKHNRRGHYSEEDERGRPARRKDYGNSENFGRSRKGRNFDDRDRTRHGEDDFDTNNTGKSRKGIDYDSEEDVRIRHGRRRKDVDGFESLSKAQNDHHISSEDIGRNPAPPVRRSFEEDMFQGRDDVAGRNGKTQRRVPSQRYQQDESLDDDTDEGAIMIPPRRLIRQRQDPPQRGSYVNQNEKQRGPKSLQEPQPTGENSNGHDELSGSHSEENSDEREGRREQRGRRSEEYGGRGDRNGGRGDGYGGKRGGYGRKKEGGYAGNRERR